MKLSMTFMLGLFTCLLAGQSNGRVESEYKLGVPADVAEDLWIFMRDDLPKVLASKQTVTTSVSIEQFRDTYFDDADRTLYEQEIGLRYRERYIQDTLAKRLVQLKTPLASDGVARTEVKFEVKQNAGRSDLSSRHPFLKYIKKRDRDEVAYLLRKYNADINDMKRAVKMHQERRRIYIKDSEGALATATLDYVTHARLPFQRYIEMELELNEVRYTGSSTATRASMEAFNQELKDLLADRYPGLYQDQTPKYNKMQQLIDGNVWSNLIDNWMWIGLGCLVVGASYSYIRAI